MKGRFWSVAVVIFSEFGGAANDENRNFSSDSRKTFGIERILSFADEEQSFIPSTQIKKHLEDFSRTTCSAILGDR